MDSGLGSWDDDDGLPDEAFTEDELAAGVQHIARTGNPNATSSGRRPVSWSEKPDDDVGRECAEGAEDALFDCNTGTLRFDTYAQARAWAQANPGRVFMRASDGQGYEAKLARNNDRVNPTQRRIDAYIKRTAEIKAMAPHLHEVLTKSASNSYRINMRPFYRTTWHAELSRLSTGQLKRLRLLIAAHLEGSREHQRLLYAEMRRFPSMKPGDYGEAVRERLIKLMEGVLVDIDTRLSEGRDS